MTTAIVRLLIDTGGRLAEITNLRWSDDPDEGDVDLDQRCARVLGKSRRERVVPIGAKTVKALDRYLRARRRHHYATEIWLWVGKRGRMRESDIYQMLGRRAKEAGIGHIHPHQFRHTFAHHWKAAGGPRRTSCGSGAGAVRTCFAGTRRQWRTNGHARCTVGFPLVTGSSSHPSHVAEPDRSARPRSGRLQTRSG